MATMDLSRPARPSERGAQDARVVIDRLILVLALAVLVIAAASFAGAMGLAGAGLGRHDPIVGTDQVSMATKFLVKFDLAGEQTVAAWLSSALMLLCTAPLFQIAALRRRLGEHDVRHWAVLGLIFVGLSMDETVGFHEMTTGPLRAAFNGSGIFLYAWVVPALAFVAVVALAYARFLFGQPAWFRNRCILAGALFVGAAVGFEMMEGAFAEFYLEHRVIHEIAAHLEDVLEFAGILVFLHALLTYLRLHSPDLRIRLE